MMTLLYIGSLFLGALGAWFIAMQGNRIGLSDKPTERSSHKTVTPKGGGVGILAAFVLSAILFELSFWIWMPAIIIAVISLIGDSLHLPQILRLFIHFTCALIVVISLSSNFRNIVPFSFVGIALIFAAAIFITGTANFYNFMDGINGIAGLTGIAAFGLLAVFQVLIKQNSDVSTQLSMIMILSLLGFLPFNYPRAKVFMGDVGSILLGFLYAVWVIRLSETWIEFVVLCSFLFPFYVDELCSMIVRLKQGDSLLQPHRRHIYQIMANQLNIEHWKVSLGYFLIQILIGLLMMALGSYGMIPVIMVLLNLFLIVFIYSIYLRKWEVLNPV